jgi:hypothetical protein
MGGYKNQVSMNVPLLSYLLIQHLTSTAMLEYLISLYTLRLVAVQQMNSNIKLTWIYLFAWIEDGNWKFFYVPNKFLIRIRTRIFLPEIKFRRIGVEAPVAYWMQKYIYNCRHKQSQYPLSLP